MKTEEKYNDRQKEVLKVALKLATYWDRCPIEKIVSVCNNRGIYSRKHRIKETLKQFVGDSNIPLTREGSLLIRTDIE